MPYSPTTWVDGTTPVNAANLNKIEAALDALYDAVENGPTVVTSLPGSPTNGQQCILVNSTTAPTYAWHMIYVSSIEDGATDYRWICIGGWPFFARNDTQSTRASASYGDAADAADPAFTVPAAGYYDISFSAELGGSGDGTPGYANVSFRVGATGATDEDAARLGETSGTNLTLEGVVARSGVRKLCAASDVIELQYRGDTADSFNVDDRMLSVMAVRLA